MSPSSRRQFVRATSAALLSPPWLVWAQDRPSSYATDYPDMLLSYLAGKLNALAVHWDAERAKIRTPEDLEARNRFVREKLRDMVHGFPEKNALKPIVVRSFDRPGYRVENVMFQSRPDFWVTGNLYIPEGSGPFPGIISPCGHYELARMQPDYQYVYMNLVRSGFVVLGYDPVGQGERRHYWNPHEPGSGLDPVYEHSMPGQALLMMGEDLTHYRIWDGMRAIDYLLTRPEVDPQRIGCAGHSGGGTLTQFISALDDRVRCAVVNEGGTNHRWPIRVRPESQVGPSDVEQNLFPAAVHGVDLCDIHVAIAPRPLLALIENYSPGFNLAAEHIRARYQLLGVSERFATEEATDPHAWTVKLRQATTNWFCRWFYNRPGPDREPEFEAEPPETLYCTPTGSIREARQGDTIFSLMLRKQSALPPVSEPPANPAAFDRYRREMQERIRSLIHVRPSGEPLAARVLVTTPRKGYRVEKIEFISEPGIYIPAWVFLPDGSTGASRATLWLNETGKEADGMEFGPLEALARQGHLVAAIDVRGVGGTTPPHSASITDPPGINHLFSVETALAYMAWFMDESLFGMRVQDVLRGVDYLRSRADVDPKGVRVIGRGAGALWGLYAAALDPRIDEVLCERPLLSYRALAQVDRYLHSAGVFIRDVLKYFDLPQVAAMLADRSLTLKSPVDAMKRPVDLATARRAYAWTEQVYGNLGAASRFHIDAS
ncbi:MAG: acetylxylan esterase [Bryobacteraceae bacterium]|nr:acetylxylan esterase [Bryobacteraceae bacterium]